MRKSVVLHGDAKLPELRHVLANCPKAKAFSYDQCKVLTAKTVYGREEKPLKISAGKLEGANQ